MPVKEQVALAQNSGVNIDIKALTVRTYEQGRHGHQATLGVRYNSGGGIKSTKFQNKTSTGSSTSTCESFDPHKILPFITDQQFDKLPALPKNILLFEARI